MLDVDQDADRVAPFHDAIVIDNYNLNAALSDIDLFQPNAKKMMYNYAN